MSENLSECELHPTEERFFQRLVLHALIGRQGAKTQGFHINEENYKEHIVTQDGYDSVLSELVGSCALRIWKGECSKYKVTGEGHSVMVEEIV